MLAIESVSGSVVLAVLPPFRLRGFLVRTGLPDGFCGNVGGEGSQSYASLADKLKLGWKRT